MTEQANPESNISPKHNSPKWNWTTKLVVGLVLAAIGFFFLIRFQNMIGPLLLSFIIAYLIYPAANFFHKKLKVGWQGSVTIIYLIIALALLAVLTWGGFTIVEQLQNLIGFIQRNITELPALIESLADQSLKIGQLEISLSFLNNSDVIDQAISSIQPLLGSAGNLVGKVVSGGANLIFWIILTMLVSYFTLAETGGANISLLSIKLPDYEEDIRRMGKELSLIWNAFIRGQLIVISVAIFVFSIILGSLGMQYFFGLALIAAFGRLIPYVGAWITWITYGLVALLQSSNPFGLTSFWYMVLVVVIALIVDNILDNILVPKVMSTALRVHPAAVLVAALIGADLLGIVGIILAAPVLASLQLIFKYATKKLTDMDPWEDLDNRPPVKKSRWWLFVQKTNARFWKWLKGLFHRKQKTSEQDEQTRDVNPENSTDAEPKI